MKQYLKDLELSEADMKIVKRIQTICFDLIGRFKLIPQEDIVLDDKFRLFQLLENYGLTANALNNYLRDNVKPREKGAIWNDSK